MAGYLAASARLDVHPLPELRSPEDGPGQPDADQRQRRDEARPASRRPDQRREMRSENQTSTRPASNRPENQTTRSSCDQRSRPRARAAIRSSDRRPAAADTTPSRLSLLAGPDHHTFFSGGRSLFSLATRLLIGRSHCAIPWPSSIGQAHGRRGNSHSSGRSPEWRRLWLRPPPHLWPRA